MNESTKIGQEKNYQEIFENYSALAENMFPNLLQDIKTFNDSKISIENYQQYINSLNQLPTSTTSNHVG